MFGFNLKSVEFRFVKIVTKSISNLSHIFIIIFLLLSHINIIIIIILAIIIFSHINKKILMGIIEF